MWTLVAAPIALFATCAIGMTVAARALVWPSFDFRGAGDMARYGGVMAAGQVFWFLQSQADVFIAGRMFDPHLLGIYTTSLFLTQIFVSKFVPPLNEVAFSAYARMRDDPAAVAAAFVRGAQLILPIGVSYARLAQAIAPPVFAAQAMGQQHARRPRAAAARPAAPAGVARRAGRRELCRAAAWLCTTDAHRRDRAGAQPRRLSCIRPSGYKRASPRPRIRCGRSGTSPDRRSR